MNMEIDKEELLFDGPTVVLLGSTDGGKTALLNFLRDEQDDLPVGPGKTTQVPVAIISKGDEGSPLPLDEASIRDRLLSRSSNPVPIQSVSKGEVLPNLIEPLPWLPDGARIVDLRGFEKWENKGDATHSSCKPSLEFLREADLILFVTGVGGEYKRGYALESLGNRTSAESSPSKLKPLIFLTKPDQLMVRLKQESEDRSVQGGKIAFHQYAKGQEIHIPEENVFLFASCVEEKSKIDKLAETGILADMAMANRKLQEECAKLSLAHLERREREIAELVEKLRENREDTAILDDFKLRTNRFDAFLERELGVRREDEQKWRAEVAELVELENSEASWSKEVSEKIDQVVFEFEEEGAQIEQRFREIHKEAVENSSWTWQFWRWEFWTSNFWRRNKWFREELEPSFRKELQKLLSIIKVRLLEDVTAISQILSDSTAKYAEPLPEERCEEWLGWIQNDTNVVKENLTHYLSGLTPIAKAEPDTEADKFPIPNCRELSKNLVEKCLQKVGELKRREHELYDEILREGRSIVEHFIWEVPEGIRRLAHDGAAGLGHELRIAATEHLSPTRQALEETRDRLTIFENAKGNLQDAWDLAG